jgi:hypothetical protein
MKGLAYIATGFTAALAVAALEFSMGVQSCRMGSSSRNRRVPPTVLAFAVVTARETGVKVAGLFH